MLIIMHHLILIIKKNVFLILGEGDTFGINGIFGPTEKSLVLILVKQRKSFGWICIIMVAIVICFFNVKEVCKFKVSDKRINFTTQFCLGSISSKCWYIKSIFKRKCPSFFYW